MPKQNINYNNTIIYKLQHKDKPELLYIGHTTQFNKMKNRLNKLMIQPTTGKYKQLQEIIASNGGFNEFNFIEIKKYSCQDANEADSEKYRIYDEIKTKLNDEKIRTERQRLITPLNYKWDDNIVLMCHYEEAKPH